MFWPGEEFGAVLRWAARVFEFVIPRSKQDEAIVVNLPAMSSKKELWTMPGKTLLGAQKSEILSALDIHFDEVGWSEPLFL